MEDPLEHIGAPNCPKCLEPMEPTDDGWECVGCAVDALTNDKNPPPDQ